MHSQKKKFFFPTKFRERQVLQRRWNYAKWQGVTWVGAQSGILGGPGKASEELMSEMWVGRRRLCQEHPRPRKGTCKEPRGGDGLREVCSAIVSPLFHLFLIIRFLGGLGKLIFLFLKMGFPSGMDGMNCGLSVQWNTAQPYKGVNYWVLRWRGWISKVVCRVEGVRIEKAIGYHYMCIKS